MEIRDLGRDRTVLRPSLDPAELAAGRLLDAGELAASDVRAEGDDLAAVQGPAELSRVWASGVSLAESELSPVELSNVRFSDAELSNAVWRRARVRRTEFLRCRGVGWRLAMDLAHDTYLHECRLDYAVLQIGKVRGLLVFAGCSLREAVIGGDLSNVIFDDCVLDGAEFQATRAGGCDLRGSRVGATRGLATLRGATLSAEQAADAGAILATEAGLTVTPT